jgi:hypothetical protein
MKQSRIKSKSRKEKRTEYGNQAASRHPRKKDRKNGGKSRDMRGRKTERMAAREPYRTGGSRRRPICRSQDALQKSLKSFELLIREWCHPLGGREKETREIKQNQRKEDQDNEPVERRKAIEETGGKTNPGQ